MASNSNVLTFLLMLIQSDHKLKLYKNEFLTGLDSHYRDWTRIQDWIGEQSLVLGWVLIKLGTGK